MNNFLSCDWGTSVFRLRFVDTATLGFSATESNNHGIAKVFELWKQSGSEDRHAFYLQTIIEHIKMLEQQTGQSFKNIPLIISGMASSSLGMFEMDYKTIPFSVDGHDLVVKKVKPAKDFNRDIVIISGVRSNDDAMRGEETQLIGCDHDLTEERIFIFPGTHSKHVTVRKGLVVDVKTYMTGEFFELLSRKSILATSIQQGEGLIDKENFEKGVVESRHSNLLHNSFLVRTNNLFKKLTTQENYYYLSGLLMGTELGELVIDNKRQITLVASAEMRQLYTTAFNVLGLNEGKNNFQVEDPALALIKGQLRACKLFAV